jgi:hypothetical protein
MQIVLPYTDLFYDCVMETTTVNLDETPTLQLIGYILPRMLFDLPKGSPEAERGIASASYRRHRFPPIVIQHAVWLYLRFTLSYRDIEDLLAERGLDAAVQIGSICTALPQHASRGPQRFQPFNAISSRDQRCASSEPRRRANGGKRPQRCDFASRLGLLLSA